MRFSVLLGRISLHSGKIRCPSQDRLHAAHGGGGGEGVQIGDREDETVAVVFAVFHHFKGRVWDAVDPDCAFFFFHRNASPAVEPNSDKSDRSGQDNLG